MEREVRLAELTGKLEEAGRKVARLWARAHAAGWQERRPTDAPAWCAALLSAYDSAKAAAAAASAECQVGQHLSDFCVCHFVYFVFA